MCDVDIRKTRWDQHSKFIDGILLFQRDIPASPLCGIEIFVYRESSQQESAITSQHDTIPVLHWMVIEIEDRFVRGIRFGLDYIKDLEGNEVTRSLQEELKRQSSRFDEILDEPEKVLDLIQGAIKELCVNLVAPVTLKELEKAPIIETRDLADTLPDGIILSTGYRRICSLENTPPQFEKLHKLSKRIPQPAA